MLDVTVTADDYDLSDELRQTAIDKIGALDEYIKGIQTAHVIFSWQGGSGEQTSVRAQVDGGGHHFEASDVDWKALTALDKTRHEGSYWHSPANAIRMESWVSWSQAPWQIY